LGAGNAHVTFHVHAGGGLSIVSVSGSSPGHAAMARRIVASSRGPGSCGSAFLSQSFRFR
ncbi:MAG: energy transducer TonB, partial [Methylocystis sp.]|nr:energy transducer TonB [Methylocystis sp.]